MPLFFSSPGHYLVGVKDYLVVLERLERSVELLGSLQPGAAPPKGAGANASVAGSAAALFDQARLSLTKELEALLHRASTTPAPPDCLLALIQYDSIHTFT